MTKEMKRLYNIEDEVVLVRAQAQKDAANGDLALFTVRFPWFTTIYLTSYQTDIDTAEAFPQDATVMTNIKVLTADVNASMAEGIANLHALFLYAELTYPKDKVKQRVFGQDLMDKARTDQEKMMNLLEHANSFASKSPYKDDLQGKGYTELETTALLTVATNIHDKNRLQENAKGSRPVTTQDRIIVHNTVFERMNTVYKCAQVVFAGNPAKIEQYRVYPPAAAATTTAQVRVSNASTGEMMPGLTVTIVDTSTSVNTNDDGIANFDLGASPADSISLEVSGSDISTQTFPDLVIIAGEVNEIEIEVVPGS